MPVRDIGVGYAFASPRGRSPAPGSPARSTPASRIPRTASPARWPAAIVAVELYKRRAASAARPARSGSGRLRSASRSAAGAACSPGFADETYGVPTACPGGSTSATASRAIRSSSTRAWRCSPSSPSISPALAPPRAPGRATAPSICSCSVYAAQRFVWEFLKPYPRVLGPLDLFQLLALVMIALCPDLRCTRSPNPHA